MSTIQCSAKSVAVAGASRYAQTLHGVRMVAAVSRPPIARFHRHDSFGAMLERQLSRPQAQAGRGSPDAGTGDACPAAAPPGADETDIGRRDDRAFLRLDIGVARLVDDVPQDDHPVPTSELPGDRGAHCSVCV